MGQWWSRVLKEDNAGTSTWFHLSERLGWECGEQTSQQISSAINDFWGHL